MIEAQRRAEAVWQGSLARGAGEVTLASSRAADALPVTWASRTARSEGKTSPEELVAAAHAACYCMALAHILGEGGATPETLSATATVTFAEVDGGFKVKSSELTVSGRVPGIDEAAFLAAAEAAKTGCPISAALQGNVEITLRATLE